MRLKRIKLQNWRSIPSCDLNLSANITVIIGQNTAGKTALLNAFLWGLYGQTTSGFTRPEDLCNHQAKLKLEVGNSTRMSVEVTFYFGEGKAEKKYVARRSLTVRRTGTGVDDFEEEQPEFVLDIFPLSSSGDARRVSEDYATQEIEAIIPSSLNSYFFFPAENITSSIGSTEVTAASIKNAASVLLGLKRWDLADTAIKEALRLPKLKEKISNDTDIRKAQVKRDVTRDRHEKAIKEKEELDSALQRSELHLREAQKAVDRMGAASSLIEERSKIQKDYEFAKLEADSSRAHRNQLLNLEFFNLFGFSVLKEAKDVLDEAKSEGKIPPRVSTGLIDELANTATKCICGQLITENAREALRKLRRDIVEDIVAELASNIWARVSERYIQLLDRQETETPLTLLRASNVAIANADRRVSVLLNKRELFDAENPSTGNEIVSDPTGAFLAHTRAVEGFKVAQKDLQKRIDSLEREKREAANLCEKLIKKQGKANAISNARAHLTSIEQTVEDIRKTLSEGARSDIETAMNKIAKGVLFRDYTIHLTPNYKIEAYQSGVEIGGSSSDQAWVNFAFVGAISRLIDEYNRKLDNIDEAGSIELEPGSGYPLVLDAPFSPFGDKYAADFARSLPGLAPQSVLIVRGDQLDHLEPILNFGPRDVRAYLMCLYGPSTVAEQELNWRNTYSYAYVKQVEDPICIRTEIVELPL